MGPRTLTCRFVPRLGEVAMAQHHLAGAWSEYQQDAKQAWRQLPDNAFEELEAVCVGSLPASSTHRSTPSPIAEAGFRRVGGDKACGNDRSACGSDGNACGNDGGADQSEAEGGGEQLLHDVPPVEATIAPDVRIQRRGSKARCALAHTPKREGGFR